MFGNFVMLRPGPSFVILMRHCLVFFRLLIGNMFKASLWVCNSEIIARFFKQCGKKPYMRCQFQLIGAPHYLRAPLPSFPLYPLPISHSSHHLYLSLYLLLPNFHVSKLNCRVPTTTAYIWLTLGPPFFTLLLRHTGWKKFSSIIF